MTARMRSGAAISIRCAGDQPAGARFGFGAGGLSGLRAGSGALGGGAMTGIWTGSTVIVRDGPSSEPRG
jgi:hypothetical protein